MIYGAEGAIGLVNLILLLSALAALGLVVSLIAYKRSVGMRRRVRAHPIRSALTTITLVLISLPTLVAAPIMLRSYIDNRSFESQNQYVRDMYTAMDKDDVAAFSAVLKICEFCVSTTNPGQRKYDQLISIAESGGAMRVKAYLDLLNRNELPKPMPDHFEWHTLTTK